MNGANPVRFRFDGVEYDGREGETLAAALVRNGVLGGFRSIYRDRPRGVFTADEQEPNALVQVGAEPMLRATLVELEDGLEAMPLAGKGRLVAAPARRFDAAHAHYDVLVVGGGRSGVAAAAAAARRVILLDPGAPPTLDGVHACWRERPRSASTRAGMPSRSSAAGASGTFARSGSTLATRRSSGPKIFADATIAPG